MSIRARNFEWIIVNTRAFAPDDFPYLPATALTKSPSLEIRRAIELQKAGDNASAEKILRDGRDSAPLARCEYSTNLAVVLYTTGRREEALAVLEDTQPLVTASSRPECQRSQFLLGSLYRENNDPRAADVFQKFIGNTQNSADPEIIGFRKQIQR